MITIRLISFLIGGLGEPNTFFCYCGVLHGGTTKEHKYKSGIDFGENEKYPENRKKILRLENGGKNLGV